MKSIQNTETRAYEEALRDHEWIAAHGEEIHEKYRGQWIAVGDNRLLAHGYNFEEVAAKARKLCSKPTFMFVPIEEMVIYEQN